MEDLFTEFEGTPVTVSYVPRNMRNAGVRWLDAPQFGSLRSAIEAVRDDRDQHLCLFIIHSPGGDRELTYDQITNLVRKLPPKAA